MITDYYRQTCSWEKKDTEVTRDGDNTFDAAVSIAARVQEIVSQNTGDHKSQNSKAYRIYTASLVQVGDKINSRTVKTVRECVNYAGVVVGVVAET